MKGWAIIESGTQLSVTTNLYNFSATQQTTSDASGKFQLCSPTVASPLALVVIALDSSNNAYPPFIAPISGTTDLGSIPMGGCVLKCGLFDGQQQTSAPATINGAITTTPIAKTGSVAPLYSITALDGSGNLWNLTMPIFNTSQPFTFTTVANGCAAQVPFCAPYTFLLPSQKPVSPIKGGYSQQAGPPVYAISASVMGKPSCVPSSGLTVLQQDGKSFLTAAPGVQLSAANINFGACQ